MGKVAHVCSNDVPNVAPGMHLRYTYRQAVSCENSLYPDRLSRQRFYGFCAEQRRRGPENDPAPFASLPAWSSEGPVCAPTTLCRRSAQPLLGTEPASSSLADRDERICRAVFAARYIRSFREAHIATSLVCASRDDSSADSRSKPFLSFVIGRSRSLRHDPIPFTRRIHKVTRGHAETEHADMSAATTGDRRCVFSTATDR